ncbi:MAG: nitrile hydratase subunit beta [Rhodospirillaceae bacterium]
MNGGHDLGGMHGLGPINPEKETEEAIFHEDWERKVFAFTVATGLLGEWNIDESRHARERQHPVDYIRNSYYENWLTGTENCLLDAGLVTEREIASGKADCAAAVTPPGPEQALNAVKAGGPADVDAPVTPAFKPGDRVRIKNFHPAGHTRAPRYTRGHVGKIVRIHGIHIFPDTHKDGVTEGVPLYSVRFEAAELWGPDATRGSAVHVDMWEPYLDKA